MTIAVRDRFGLRIAAQFYIMSDAILASPSTPKSEKNYGAWTLIASASNKTTKLSIPATEISPTPDSSQYPIIIAALKLNSLSGISTLETTLILGLFISSSNVYKHPAFNDTASKLTTSYYYINNVLMREGEPYIHVDDKNTVYTSYIQSGSSWHFTFTSSVSTFALREENSDTIINGRVGQLSVYILGLENTLGL